MLAPRRRIFRHAAVAPPRRWRGAAILLGAGGVAALAAGVGVPGALFGSGPGTWRWSGAADEVRVVDGETLRLGDGRVVRLAGLAVPPRGGAPCSDRAGRRFDCGAAAAERLAALVADRPVECRVSGRDAQRRGTAVCSAGGVEVNGALVAAGYARADGSAGDALSGVEARARSEGRGLWGGGARPEGWTGG